MAHNAFILQVTRKSYSTSNCINIQQKSAITPNMTTADNQMPHAVLPCFAVEQLTTKQLSMSALEKATQKSILITIITEMGRLLSVTKWQTKTPN